MLGLRWIPGIDVKRAELRTTLMYRLTPTFMAGIEVNPLANWLALPETANRRDC